MTAAGSVQPDAASPERNLLLKAALTEGPRALEYWKRWRTGGNLETLDDASYPSLPMLFWNLQSYGADAPDLGRLQGVYRFHWSRNQLILQTLKGLTLALAQAGIEAVLLKGAAHLCRADHARFVRPINDLELLVSRDRVKQTLELLRPLGWNAPVSPNAIDARVLRAVPSITLQRKGHVRCSVSWAPFQGATWEGAESTFWSSTATAPAGELRAKILAPTEQLVHLCAHGRFHGDSPLFDHAADALLLLRTQGAAIDWVRLIRLGTTYELTAHLEQALRFLRDELSAPVSAGTMETLATHRASRRERLQQGLAGCRGWRRIVPALQLHWLYHCSSLPGAGTTSRLARFPTYVHYAWRLRRRPFGAEAMDAALGAAGSAEPVAPASSRTR
jgi:hypothetical protein